MREIKFRVWDNVDNKMYYTGEESDIHFYFDSNGIVATRFFDEEVCTPEGDRGIYGNSEQLEHLKYMQYTGLKDKNDVEIYEGDIVQGTYEEFSDYDHEEYTIEFVSQVTFENGAFCIKRDYVNFEGRMRGPSLNKHWDSEKVAVIGNALENPELLEVTK